MQLIAGTSDIGREIIKVLLAVEQSCVSPLPSREKPVNLRECTIHTCFLKKNAIKRYVLNLSHSTDLETQLASLMNHMTQDGILREFFAIHD